MILYCKIIYYIYFLLFIIYYLLIFFFFFNFRPKGKLDFETGKVIQKKQYYLVPLLFPYKKPSNITLFNGKLTDFKRNNEWTIQVKK